MENYKNNFISFIVKDEILFINIENTINPSEKEFNELIEWWGYHF